MLDINNFSNPKIVQSNLDKYANKHIPLYLSTRKNKKYMIEIDDKTIHFGQYGAEDFTKHKDKKRRDNFKIRNAKWANSPKWSAGALSYYLLW
jgi:hypothetical protein